MNFTAQVFILIFLCMSINSGYSIAKPKLPRSTTAFELTTDESQLCGSWTLIKVTNPAEKTIYLDDGTSTLHFHCDSHTWNLQNTIDEPTESGTWIFDASTQSIEMISNGISVRAKIITLSKRKLVLSENGNLLEYSRK